MNILESKPIKYDWSFTVAILLFAIVLTWWGSFFFIQADESSMLQMKGIWGACYQIAALWGGIWGLMVAKSWGGRRSLMGRAIGAFAIGLLLQNFGQSVFSYYNLVLQVELPYPSLADIGYFGSIPFYIYGTLMLAKASGIKISLKSFSGKIQAVLLPLAMLTSSYYFFLKGYEFDWSAPLQVFLDFGYPLGQAVYVSCALLAYFLSTKTLGGAMKNKVLLILFALLIQYFADYNFLFQASAGTWNVSGYGDILYLTAYFLMAIGLIQLKPKLIHTTGIKPKK